jgi:hypothetical protein
MASAPSQASQRRSSPSERPASPHASPSIARTQSSPDSDVVVVGASQPGSAAGSIPQPKTAAAEIRRCWVCMGDETDDPENNIWRSPCPCSLIAHESCLLEWIADKESPPPGQIAHTHEIKCPQCQTPLKILRPRDPLVTLTDGVQRIARSLILPTALCGVVGCFYSGFLSYGANTLALVFGTDAANALLAQPTFNSIHTSHIARWLQVAGDHGLRAFGQLFPFFPRVRSPANIPYYLGLPLIGPSLVLWRTSFGDIGFSMLIPIVSPLTFAFTSILTSPVLLRLGESRYQLASCPRPRFRHTSIPANRLHRVLQIHLRRSRKEMGSSCNEST